MIFVIGEGEVLYRHHRKSHGAIHFGTTGMNRFDDPSCPAPGSYGMLYVGANPECCLLESCGDTTGVPALSGAYVEARQITRIQLIDDLRFIDLVTPGGAYQYRGRRPAVYRLA